MKERVPKAVDDYISAQPEVLRPKLEQVRAAIQRAVPEAQEVIGYCMPGYKLNGKPLLYSPVSSNTIRCLRHQVRSSPRSKKNSRAMSSGRGLSISHSISPFRCNLSAGSQNCVPPGFPPRPKKEEPGQQKGTRKSPRKKQPVRRAPAKDRSIFWHLSRLSARTIFRFSYHRRRQAELGGNAMKGSPVPLAVRQQNNFAEHSAFAQHLVRTARLFER
jgi:hypothetical protein